MVHLTQHGCKVLLLYDGYRRHISYDALRFPYERDAIFLAIPAHISNTTQPLDVGIFCPFKSRLNLLLHNMCSTLEYNVIDVSISKKL